MGPKLQKLILDFTRTGMIQIDNNTVQYLLSELYNKCTSIDTVYPRDIILIKMAMITSTKIMNLGFGISSYTNTYSQDNGVLDYNDGFDDYSTISSHSNKNSDIIINKAIKTILGTIGSEKYNQIIKLDEEEEGNVSVLLVDFVSKDIVMNNI